MVRRFPIIAIILTTAVIVACMTTGDPAVDAKLSYLTARDSFNAALRNYSARVTDMAPGAEKDSVKESFNPFWKDAEKALDSWGGIVKGLSNDDPSMAVNDFLEAKNKLIELGLKYFGDRLFDD